MSNILLELQQIGDESVGAKKNVLFDTSSPIPEGIAYDELTGIITFNKMGAYSVKWWVATRTTLHGTIQFALHTSQGDVIPGCSPLKNGQVSGFGAINVTEEGMNLWLENQSSHTVVFSDRTEVNAFLLVTSITASSGVGTIIPFSTGDRPTTLMTNANGERSMATILGFGSAAEIDAPNDPITFYVTPGAEPYYAFSMPTDGIITALSAKFILTDVYPQIDNTINVQLYYSPTLDNTFIPVRDAAVVLGTVSGSDPLGTVLNGIVTDLNVPITAQTSLLLIFYNTTTAQEVVEVRGAMQGGLLIE